MSNASALQLGPGPLSSPKGSSAVESGTTLLLLLGLLALLLHPIVPNRASRLLRLLITPIGLYYASIFIRKGGFDWRETSVLLHQCASFFGPFAALRVLEWGLARDVTPYTWVGFGEDGYTREFPTKTSSSMNGNSLNDAESAPDENEVESRRKQQLEVIRQKSAQTETPIEVMKSTIHLILCPRGTGWAFAPPRRSQAPPSPLPVDPKRPFDYLWASFEPVLWSLASFALAIAMNLRRVPQIEDDLARWFPFAPRILIDYFAIWPLGLSGLFGIVGGANLLLRVVACADLCLRELSRRLPSVPDPLRLPPFDPRQYPPLFQARWPRSVAQAWSECWHQLAARPFRALALNPVVALLKPITGKDVARAIGVMASFALSAWLHEDYEPREDATLLVRYGSWIYFLIQGAVVVGEQMFTRLTGCKVSGWVGFWWTTLFSGISGTLRIRAAAVQ